MSSKYVRFVLSRVCWFREPGNITVFDFYRSQAGTVTLRICRKHDFQRFEKYYAPALYGCISLIYRCLEIRSFFFFFDKK